MQAASTLTAARRALPRTEPRRRSRGLYRCATGPCSFRPLRLRRRETLAEAFAYLEKLRVEGILSATVVTALHDLAAEGAFDRILSEARGAALSPREVRFLRGRGWGRDA